MKIWQFLQENIISEDFYKLACKFIAFGISIYDLNNPYEKARRCFKRLRRNKLRYTLINAAFKKHRKMIDVLKIYIMFHWRRMNEKL